MKLKRGMGVARDVLIPDPLSSDRQFARFYHLDLSELQDRETTDELHYLWLQLWGLDSDHWARARVQILEEELARRRGVARYEPSRKPKPAEGVKL